MTIGISLYRARVGGFHDRAAQLSVFKLAFISASEIWPFLVLYLEGSRGINVALILFILLNNNQASNDLHTYKDRNETSATFTPDYSYVGTRKQVPDIKSFCFTVLPLIIIQLLLQTAGDIHLNPGPPCRVQPKELSIIHINARSLRRKLDLLDSEVTDHDVITISETWLSADIKNNEISINGYHPPVRKDRSDDPHGGVAIYVKNSLICKERHDLSIPQLEAVWIETKIGQDKLLIGSFYRPPNSKSDYWDLIDQSIKNVSSTPHKFIVLGDFNTNFLSNPSPQLLDVINFNNLQQVVTHPTRITETSATLLDLVLTSCIDIISHVDVLPPVCSDHSVPCVKLIHKIKHSPSFKRTIYDYRKLDVEKLSNELSNVRWMDIVSLHSIEEAAQLFSDTLHNTAKKCMPVKKIRPIK